jgi:hypothetical protein
MLNSIFVFFMVLSTIYLSKFIIEFLLNFFAEVPSPLKISNIDRIFLYLSISYIITFLIRLPNV